MEKVFWVEGIHCSACVDAIEQLLKENPCVLQVHVHLAEKKVFLQLSQEISLQELNQLVSKAGYQILELQEDNNNKFNFLRIIWLLSLSTFLMLLGMFSMGKLWSEWIMALISGILIYEGRKFYLNAYKQAKIKKASMDTLVSLSTGISFIYSIGLLSVQTFLNNSALHHYHTHFEAAGMIIAFVLIGKYLEDKVQASTQRSLKKILTYKNKKVTKCLNDGSFVEIFVKDIQPNDNILIKAGEQIPIDGIVLEGESYVDESMMTGLPLPAEKKPHSKVYAGTINQYQNIIVKAEKIGESTFLEQILKAVERAQASKPDIQKITDKIAGQFTFFIIGISLLTFFLWMLQNDFEHAFTSMIAVLVVACPCALGLATPMAVIVGIGKAAQHGILIQNANALEKANHISLIAFDKTGTLTTGKPNVQKVLWNETPKPHWPWLWFKLAQQSNHPLATAIHNYFFYLLQNSPQVFLQFQDVQTIAGKGIKAILEDSMYLMGNENFLQQNGIVIPDTLKMSLEEYNQQGNSFVFFARNQHCLGVCILADTLRPDVPQTIQILQKKGYKLCILSGDNQETVKFYAQQLGIQNYEGELLPMQKAKKIAKFEVNGQKTLMVGDGINDSIALSKATISVAFSSGNELTSNVAQVLLIKNEIHGILKFLEIAKQTHALIYQNLFWAFIYNLLMIPLATGLFYPILGWRFHPMWASIAMSLSSISIVLNSLRLNNKSLCSENIYHSEPHKPE